MHRQLSTGRKGQRGNRQTTFHMAIFVVTVFLGSFLLFAVEPMVAKFLLPSFGGTAAVWSTCMVVFQTLLLAGYAYAHLLRTALTPKAQRWTHLVVLVLALLFLPPVPVVHLAANSTGTPVWELLRCLFTSIGVPFFALSATAPLLMEWFRQSYPGRSPDRLYAFSNAGSLLALLCYPALLEPAFTRHTQAWLWAGGMAVFLGVCAVAAWRSLTPGAPASSRPGPTPKPLTGRAKATHAGSKPALSVRLPAWLWIALPACGSGLLLALTNQLSQDVAPMPLLWVVPMAIYLLTFILCFEGPRSYKRGLFIPGSFVGFLALAWLLDQGYLQGFWVQVGGYLSVLFLGCMVCHGELYRLRPGPERLTAYYLALSLGGAVGGIFVGLVAPAIFRTFLETPLLAIAVPSLVAFIVWQGKTRWAYRAVQPAAVAVMGTLVIALSLGYSLLDLRKKSVYVTRSFYGAYRVKESPTLLLDGVEYPLSHGTARVLLSGQIYHGLQFTDPEAAKLATAYFTAEGGLGLALGALPVATNRIIGVIGLGAGTIAAYGRPGDHIRYYDINPDVIRIANTWFTFLSNSQAHVEVVLGDGRLSLERESTQGFDLLVLDAFAGDSIPMHLLTDEAMRTYQRQLKSDGVMAFHISNSHLDLEPVVRALADKYGMTAVMVPPNNLDPREGKLPSVWMLLSANRVFLNQLAIAELVRMNANFPWRKPLLWTDDYSSILPILH
jgi:hypothetical protein